jgi:hypothetical protein
MDKPEEAVPDLAMRALRTVVRGLSATLRGL